MSNDIERGAYQVTERNMNGTGRFADEMASRMPITIGEACLQASLFLEAQDVGEPRSNAELLLMHQLGLTGRSCCVICATSSRRQQLAAWASSLSAKLRASRCSTLSASSGSMGWPFAVTPAVLVPPAGDGAARRSCAGGGRPPMAGGGGQ